MVSYSANVAQANPGNAFGSHCILIELVELVIIELELDSRYTEDGHSYILGSAIE